MGSRLAHAHCKVALSTCLAVRLSWSCECLQMPFAAWVGHDRQLVKELLAGNVVGEMILMRCAYVSTGRRKVGAPMSNRQDDYHIIPRL